VGLRGGDQAISSLRRAYQISQKEGGRLDQCWGAGRREKGITWGDFSEFAVQVNLQGKILKYKTQQKQTGGERKIYLRKGGKSSVEKKGEG